MGEAGIFDLAWRPAFCGNPTCSIQSKYLPLTLTGGVCPLVMICANTLCEGCCNTRDIILQIRPFTNSK